MEDSNLVFQASYAEDPAWMMGRSNQLSDPEFRKQMPPERLEEWAANTFREAGISEGSFTLQVLFRRIGFSNYSEFGVHVRTPYKVLLTARLQDDSGGKHELQIEIRADLPRYNSFQAIVELSKRLRESRRQTRRSTEVT